MHKRNAMSFGKNHRGFGRRKFNKLGNGGSYSYPKIFSDARRYSNGPKSELGDDISIFIKKATGAADEAAYIPQNRFANLSIVEPLKQNIANKNYCLPTPIQDKAILPILEGRDLIGLANTGTGKTAAFFTPLITKIYTDRDQRVLIVTPTRELAGQINEDLHVLSRGMGIYSSLAIGGACIKKQHSQ